MNEVNKKLIEYLEQNIFPIYEKNDAGHRLDHIQYVIKRSFAFARKLENIDVNMVYVIAVFHDVAHHMDKDKHEALSAQIFYKNEKMKEFFTEEQRKIIKEAIEDHRASLNYVPRSEYGKILSSADRNVDIITSLKRTHAYSIKHYPELDLNQMINRAYEHISEKFGKDGYAKTWFVDEEFNKFKEDVKMLLKDKYLFAVKYMEANDIAKKKRKSKII